MNLEKKEDVVESLENIIDENNSIDVTNRPRKTKNIRESRKKTNQLKPGSKTKLLALGALTTILLSTVGATYSISKEMNKPEPIKKVKTEEEIEKETNYYYYIEYSQPKKQIQHLEEIFEDQKIREYYEIDALKYYKYYKNSIFEEEGFKELCKEVLNSFDEEGKPLKNNELFKDNKKIQDEINKNVKEKLFTKEILDYIKTKKPAPHYELELKKEKNLWRYHSLVEALIYSSNNEKETKEIKKDQVDFIVNAVNEMLIYENDLNKLILEIINSRELYMIPNNNDILNIGKAKFYLEMNFCYFNKRDYYQTIKSLEDFRDQNTSSGKYHNDEYHKIIKKIKDRNGIENNEKLIEKLNEIETKNREKEHIAKK